jgi:hypothetical protein
MFLKIWEEVYPINAAPLIAKLTIKKIKIIKKWKG